MRYLLDTCAISDFIKGEFGTIVRFKQTSPVDIAISAITFMELGYGLALNPQRAIKSSHCDLLISGHFAPPRKNIHPQAFEAVG